MIFSSGERPRALWALLLFYSSFSAKDFNFLWLHLFTHNDKGDFVYHHATRTAVPKSQTVDQGTQTDTDTLPAVVKNNSAGSSEMDDGHHIDRASFFNQNVEITTQCSSVEHQYEREAVNNDHESLNSGQNIDLETFDTTGESLIDEQIEDNTETEKAYEALMDKEKPKHYRNKRGRFAKKHKVVNGARLLKRTTTKSGRVEEHANKSLAQGQNNYKTKDAFPGNNNKKKVAKITIASERYKQFMKNKSESRELFACCLCLFRVKKPDLLMKHIEQKHDGCYPYACENCCVPFYSENHYLKHLPCKSALLKAHMCMLCEEKRYFVNTEEFMNHMKHTHNGILPLSCGKDGCEAKLASVYQKQQHTCQTHVRSMSYCASCHEQCGTLEIYQ